MEESSLHINFLELRAIHFALIHFLHLLSRKHVLSHTDNIYVKAHINKQGGTKSSALNKEVLQFMQWAELHVALVTAGHVKGSVNPGQLAEQAESAGS